MRTIALNSLILSLTLICFVTLCLAKTPDRAGDKNVPAVIARPFLFLENKGQLIDTKNNPRTDIDFKLSVPGINIAVGGGMIQYQWNKVIRTEEGDAQKTSLSIYSLDVFLDGANPNAQIIKEEGSNYKENYYLPQCPDGVTAHSFKKITYKNIYPNIDWVLYTTNNTLKYDFVVHPGGNVNDIQLSYSGDSALKMHKGALTAYTPFGNITEEAPYAYQTINEDGKEIKKDVPAHFLLQDKKLKFETGSYEGTLTIDPTVRWSGYLGGTNNDFGYAVACQADYLVNFKVFMAGSTISYNIFATPGGHQQFNAEPIMNSGVADGFIAAYNQNGGPAHTAEWITFYGGPEIDEFRSAVCDKNGNLYLAGATRSSTGVAAGTGIWQSSLGGGPISPNTQFLDGMLVKFNSNTGQRIWGTYIGGNGWDRLWSVALDPSDNIYVAGETYSSDFAKISTTGSFREVNNSTYKDAFLMKFNPAGGRLWGTYYGDDKDDFGTAVICDRNGDVYLAGYTRDDTCGSALDPSKDTLIATPGAFKTLPSNVTLQMCPPPVPPPVPPPPIIDAFLVKFSGAGVRQWGTYYGGSGDDFINSLAYDSTRFVAADAKYTEGVIYVGGKTTSSTGISSPDGWKVARPGQEDGFIAAFLPSGKRYWGTYYGTSGNDAVNGLDVDNYGALLVVGETGGLAGMATGDAYRLNNTGAINTYDAFFGIFNQALNVYGTYFGGTRNDHATAIVCNDVNQAYISGFSYSDDASYHYSNTNQLHGPSHHGTAPFDCDALVSRIDPDGFPVKLEFAQFFPMNECPGRQYSHPVGFPPPALAGLLPGNTFTVQMSDATGSFINAQTIGSGGTMPTWTIPKNTPPGSYMIRVISTRPLSISQTQSVIVSRTPYPVITSNAIGCEGDTIFLTATDTITSGTLTYQWTELGGTFISKSRDTIIVNADTSHAGRYVLVATVDGACFSTDTIDIVVNPKPGKPIITNNSPICEGEMLTFTIDADTTNSGGLTLTGPGFVNNNNLVVNIPGADMTRNGLYTATITRKGCSNSATSTAVVELQPKITTLSSNTPICFEDTIFLNAAFTPSGVYGWTGPAGFTSTILNPVIEKGKLEMNGYYKFSVVLGNCSTADSILVSVMQLMPTPTASNNGAVKTGDELQLYAADIPGATYSWKGPNGFTSTDQNPKIANVTSAAAGTYIVTATLDGCTAVSTTIVVVLDVSDKKEVIFALFPNPNKGEFTIKATISGDQAMPMEILNIAGQSVHQQTLKGTGNPFEEKINIPGSLAAGVYQLRMRVDGKVKTLTFVVKK